MTKNKVICDFCNKDIYFDAGEKYIQLSVNDIIRGIKSACIAPAMAKRFDFCSINCLKQYSF